MDFEQAKEKAVKYLVLSLRTEEEVKNKLRKLNVEEDTICEVTEYLKSIGYIDDSKYIDAYLRQSVSIPKYSVYEIKMKLMQKGINKNLLYEKLNAFDKATYEKKIVEKLLNGKLKGMEPLKQKAYLYRRGFNSNIDVDD
ncbi:MAG: regulatory protein RecX [Clostridia bacterium]|nr:regulatory protein RecX [Clostridia bacterium]